MSSDSAGGAEERHVNFGETAVENVELDVVEPAADEVGHDPVSERDDARSFTTIGSDGGRRRKLKFFSLHDLNRLDKGPIPH